MAVDSNTRLARQLSAKDAPAQAPTVTRRQGEVVSVEVDGTATVTIGGDPETVAGVASYTHYTPVAGDTVELEVQDTEVTILGAIGDPAWANAGFGASPYITTSEPRSATTYGALATPGPSITVPVGPHGVLLVHIRARIQCLSDNDGGAVSFTLSGANTAAADDNYRLSYVGLVVNSLAEFGATFPLFNLNPGDTTITMVYKDLFDTGNDVEYARRQVWGWPL